MEIENEMKEGWNPGTEDEMKLRTKNEIKR